MKIRLITTIKPVNYETNEGTREITAEEIARDKKGDEMGNRTEYYIDRVINDTIYLRPKYYEGRY